VHLYLGLPQNMRNPSHFL